MNDADHHLKRQRALVRLGQVALQSDDAHEIQTEACRLVAEALGTGLAAVLEVSAEADAALISACAGWGHDLVSRSWIPLGRRSPELGAIRRSRPTITSDVALEWRFDFIPIFMRRQPVSAMATVPILRGGGAFGVLQVHSCSPRRFSREEIGLLQAFATTLGIVVDRMYKAREAEQARRIADSAGDYAIVVTDRAGLVTQWLGAAAATFGWVEDEIVGKPAALLYTSEDRAAGVPEQEVERASREGAAFDARWRARKGGGRVFVDGKIIALRDADGEIYAFLTVGKRVIVRGREEDRRAFPAGASRAPRRLADM